LSIRYSCYAAKAHPELAQSANELVFTFNCNNPMGANFTVLSERGEKGAYSPQFASTIFTKKGDGVAQYQRPRKRRRRQPVERTNLRTHV
jgi:hypothetical protein